jgi:photosystem II stability/assembly factor-like uncharacterized protein
MKKFGFIFLVLCFVGQLTYGQWTRSSTGSANWLNGVYAVDQNTVYAVGFAGTIIKTTDGGTSWIKQTSGVSTYILSVQFLDQNTGWVCGYQGMILKTTDGGTNWFSQSLSITKDFEDIFFLDANLGWATGGGEIVYKTTDGGTSWAQVFNRNSMFYKEIQFVDANTGWVTGWDELRQTTDGGTTWNLKSLSTSSYLRSLFFLNATTGWVVGESGLIKKTTDGGTTWTTQTNGSTKNIEAVHFVDANNGWTVGLSGSIHRTTDGGASWISESSWSSPAFRHVHFSSLTNGWAVGADSIFKYSTPLPLGTIAGKVTNAIDGSALANVKVYIAGDSTTTDSQGAYTITNVPEGVFAANFDATPLNGTVPLNVQFLDQSSNGMQTVTANAVGFSQYINRNVLITNGQTTTLNFSLSPTLAVGGMRFVLNWNATPRDLDFFLLTPSIEGTIYKVYYGSKGQSTTAPYATLDYDVTTGYGPETITIYNSFSGTYKLYVNRYTSDALLNASNASVQIYSNSGLVQTITIPMSGEGVYWHVANIDGTTKAITIVNQIISTEPTSLRGLKRPKPPTQFISTVAAAPIQSWNWNFGDGNSSTLQNPAHVYQNSGTYTVSLTVNDGTSSDTKTKSNLITATAANVVTPGSTPSTAATLDLNAASNAQLSDTSLIHYWKVTIPADGYLAFKMSYDSLNGINNAYLSLFDIDSVTMIFNDWSSNATKNAFHFLKPGTYYVKVNRTGGTTFVYELANTFAPQPATNDVEPNDNMSTAQILPVNSSASGHIGYYSNTQTDLVDFWKINVLSDGYVTIKLASDSLDTRLHPLNLQLSLYDIDSTSLIANDWSGNAHKNVRYFLQPGMYYIRVNRESGTAGSYFIENNFVPADLLNDTEPNDYAKQSIDIDPNGMKTGHLGYFSKGHYDLIDWYKVTIPNDGFLRTNLQFDSLDQSTLPINFHLSLYDIDSTSLIANDWSDRKNKSMSRYLKPGTYYARIDKASGTAGSYTLTTIFMPQPRMNDPEPNDYAVQASLLPFNLLKQGHLGYYGGNQYDNNDWWKFTIAEDAKVDIALQFDSLDIQASPVNLHLSLFDVDSARIIANDWSDRKNKSAFRYLKPGTYYARIDKASGTATSYELKASFSTPPRISEIEGNDTYQTSISLPYSEKKTGHIGYFRNDTTDLADYWKITVPATDSIYVHVVGDDPVDPQLTIFDSDGTTIIKIDHNAGPAAVCGFQSTSGNIYYARVERAGNTAGSYLIVAQRSSVLDIAAPSAPNNLVATALPGGLIELKWDQNSDPAIAGYHIYYQHSDSASFNGRGANEGISPISIDRRSMFRISGLNVNRSYKFAVKAYDNAGRASTFSNIVLATPIEVLEWSLLYSGNLSNFSAVDFIDPMNGWVAGSNGTILKTTDGGIVWTAQSSSLTVDLYGIDFTDNLFGWAIGDGNKIIKTTDGGITWTLQPAPRTDRPIDIHFINRTTGWISGDAGMILFTSDGGANWTSQTSKTTTHLASIHFVDAMNGWAAGQQGIILHTTDGGTNWNIQPTPPQTNVHLFGQIDFTDLNNGWAVGENGIIIRTTNGGTNWTLQPSGTLDTLWDVDFIDPSTGWAVASNGSIYKTTNGGSSWTKELCPNNAGWLNVQMLSKDLGFAVGSSGTILKYRSGGGIAIPTTPTGFAVTAKPGAVFELTWNPLPDSMLVGYKVFYNVADSISFNGSGAIEGPSPVIIGKRTGYMISGLTVGKKYKFAIAAFNAIGKESPLSEIAEAVALAPKVFPRPRITAIWDVPNDNGRQVYIKWKVDSSATTSGIKTFAVWSWNKDSALWVNVKGGFETRPDTIHSTIVGTIFDSTKAKGMYWTVFQVSAHGVLPGEYAFSTPDSGYSLDNLAPAVPRNFNGTLAAARSWSMKWSPNIDDDFKHYILYRSLTAGFKPDVGTKIAELIDTAYVDNTVEIGKTYYYKLTAVDHSGNESDAASVTAIILSVADADLIPKQYSMDQNYPNPFNPATSIRYGIPERSNVRLVVFNMLGQTVAMLENTTKEAGYYTIQWKPNAASGIYYYRIDATSLDHPTKQYAETRKLILLK